MAEKACHVVGSATQVGLTQALGRMKYSLSSSAKQAGALLLALTAAWAIGAYVAKFVPYAFVLACAAFAALFWRRRATSSNFAVRFGTASFAVALFLIWLRNTGAIGGVAA